MKAGTWYDYGKRYHCIDGPGGAALLAQEWDNCGLQCGDGGWPVKQVMVALDPSPEVVSAACEKGVDLLITHHPLIFQPIKRLRPG
ncbi:MAG: Nif3-like dinuclear metal center hexameric protein [Desulfobacterales bacterium]